MKYNIKTHILDHAHFVSGDTPETNKKLTHFNTSVCASYFIRNDKSTQKEIDTIMVDILKSVVKKELKIKEKNGTYVKKNGKKIQRHRTRTIKFDKILVAYHNRHFNSSKSVMPHFHFLFDSSVRVGKDFMYLKQALSDEAKKYRIKFNYMEQKQATGLSKKQLSRIENLSWLLNQGNVPKIKKYLSNSDKLKDTLNLLQTHYQNTQNISYFIKVLSVLNQRLQELDFDFVYKNINLKENSYFFLNARQKKMLSDLEKGQTVELDLSNVLDREILKKSHHFQSDAVDLLLKKFNLTALSPRQLRYSKKYDANSPNSTKKNSFRKLIIEDLRDALAYAKDEKDWKAILLKMGYIKVSINSSKNSGKRTKTAITVTTKKKSTVQIPFHSMNLNFKKITQIMMHNKKRSRKKKNYDNSFDNYQKRRKRQAEILEKYIVQMKLLLHIYSNAKNKSIIDKERLKNLAGKYTIHHSDMYKITTYQIAGTTIIDNDTSITLNRSDHDTEDSTISDMLDMAILKGWNLSLLTIKGLPNLVDKVKKQIQRRLQSDKLEQKPLGIGSSTHLKI